MDIKVIKEAVREVLKEELPKILEEKMKELLISLIPEDEPKEDEVEFLEEEIDLTEYVSLEEVLKKYESSNS
jgi:hypothetical protein